MLTSHTYYVIESISVVKLINISVIFLPEWTTETNGCIMDNNDLILNGNFTLDDCKLRCQVNKVNNSIECLFQV